MQVIKAKYIGHDERAYTLLSTAAQTYSQAREQARALVSSARARLKKAIRRVRLRAYQRGYEFGRKQFEASLATRLRSIQEIYEQSVYLAQRDCLDLVIEICTEILQSEIRTSRDSIAIRLERALHGLIDTSKVLIQVNPSLSQDLAFSLRQKCPDLRFQIEAVASLEPGDLVIITAAGEIKLNWRAQLQDLSRKLGSRLKTIMTMETNSPYVSST